jgi:riboflavin kinase / FMN adenylyltransferase
MSIASFTTQQVRGKGRGKLLGFPTINMQIPGDLVMDEGIYAAWIGIGEARYKGALHYGPVPVFGENQPTLEVFLLDVTPEAVALLDMTNIYVSAVKRLRDVRSFATSDELVQQIRQDVIDVRASLED